MKTNKLIKEIRIQKKGILYKIVCRLDDKCNNGHEDFSITYTSYEYYRGKWRESGGGCGSDLWKELNRPDLKLICDLHLSQFNGVPMFAIENAFYWLEKGNVTYAQNILRATDEEMEELQYISNKGDFRTAVVVMGLPNRWKAEALECIKWLSSETDYEFESAATNPRIIPTATDEEIAAYMSRKDNYTKKGFEKMKREKFKNEIKKECDSSIEYEIKRYRDAIQQEKNTAAAKMKLVKFWRKFNDFERALNSFYISSNGVLKFYSWNTRDISQEEKELITKILRGQK